MLEMLRVMLMRPGPDMPGRCSWVVSMCIGVEERVLVQRTDQVRIHGGSFEVARTTVKGLCSDGYGIHDACDLIARVEDEIHTTGLRALDGVSPILATGPMTLGGKAGVWMSLDPGRSRE